jgi:hypothetical protein
LTGYIPIELIVPELKRKRSYLNRIPSIDFTSDVYELFLSMATPEELEEDILTIETSVKISNQLIK